MLPCRLNPMNAIAAAILLMFVSSCTGRGEEAAPPPSTLVRVMVLKADRDAPLQVRGTVQANARLRLGFILPGVVAAVLVKEGDKVRRGQLLAKLDQTNTLIQVRAAAAARNKAQRDWQKAKRLADQGALPAGTRDDARDALESASANQAAALLAFKQTQLLSPVSGNVVQRLAQPGESVGAGVPVLVIDDVDALLVKVGVTGRDLERLTLDQPVSLQLEDGSPPFKGKVTTLSPTPNPADGLYVVEVQPEQTALQLGTLVTVRFEDTKSPETLQIPIEAIVRRQDKDWVFVVEGVKGEEDKSVAMVRAVELGRSEGRLVNVRTGLKDGERVITEGAYFLQNEQPVRILQVDGGAP
jgi:membrane fusion protein, multidrug efflux system